MTFFRLSNTIEHEVRRLLNPTIVAHRGASKLAPENTMAAFNKCYQQGAHGIETDVQLTKDNIPVLLHDETLKRTTNRKGYLNDYTYQQLQEVDAGSWFGEEFTGERIISLESFLKWAKQKTLYLNLELKNNKIDYKHLEEIVYELLKYYRLLNRTTISSFNSTSIKRMKSFNSHVEIAYLTSKKKKNLVSFATYIGANALHIKYRLLQQNVIKQCQQAKMNLRVYTVNRPVHMRKCFHYGCNSIITDYPKTGIEHYNQFINLKK